jgi:type VI protein secretion system component Hcp
MTIYAKIAGISGDVTAEGYENWIPLLAVDFPGINAQSISPSATT